MTRAGRIDGLKAAARERILVLDGSWGVMIQRRDLAEADFRGDRFAAFPGQLKGNNDILCLTRPDIIADLHDQYFASGADISETNTFSSTVIAQDDYGLTATDVRDMNLAGARLAREAADRWTAKNPAKPRFAAGSIGPLNKMLSMSSDVNDPGARLVTFDQVYAAYKDQARALHEGGVDLFLIETITDTLNCKAALKAIMDLGDEGYEALPIWISGTITDRSGRTLSGQTAEAFWNSVKHAKPFAIGFNCALGADLMRPHIAELSRIADTLVAAYPNAGLPNAMGQYDEEPHETAHALSSWAKDGIVNIVGGCCGTTPEHIACVAKDVDGLAPREVPERPRAMRLAGLEPFESRLVTLALSPVETEQLRDLRARLNRTPKGSMGDRSVGPLSKGFFVLCPRVGLSPQSGGAPLATLADLKPAIGEADLVRLKQIIGQLEGLRGTADAKVWRQVFDAGVLSAILTRRLILGGKEPLQV